MLGHFTHEPPAEPLMPTLVIVHEDPTGDPFNDGPRCRYHILDRITGREWAGVESFEFALQLIAPELAEAQTLANLRAFSDRLHLAHGFMQQRGRCRCQTVEKAEDDGPPQQA